MGKVGFFKQKTFFSKEILVGVLEEWTDFRVKLTDINSSGARLPVVRQVFDA